MATFTELRAKLTEALNQLEGARSRAALAKTQITTANTAIGGLGAIYSPMAADINAAATAAPGDPAWQDLKAEKDRIVADFTAIKATVQSMVDALNSITI